MLSWRRQGSTYMGTSTAHQEAQARINLHGQIFSPSGSAFGDGFVVTSSPEATEYQGYSTHAKTVLRNISGREAEALEYGYTQLDTSDNKSRTPSPPGKHAVRSESEECRSATGARVSVTCVKLWALLDGNHAQGMLTLDSMLGGCQQFAWIA